MTVMNNGKPDRKAVPQPKFERQLDDPNSIGILTTAEKDELRERAKKLVLNELKKREEDALLAQYVKEERQKTVPDEMLVPIWLTLAPVQGEYVLLDNKQYFNEYGPYWVPPGVFATLIEIQSRGWAHEDETDVRDVRTKRRVARARPPHVGGQNYADNRRERNLVVSSGQLQGTSAESILGIR